MVGIRVSAYYLRAYDNAYHIGRPEFETVADMLGVSQTVDLALQTLLQKLCMPALALSM